MPQTGTRQEKIAAMTQQLARLLQEGIARHPQDWHMLQKVFVADLHAGGLRPAGRQPPLRCGCYWLAFWRRKWR